MTRNTLYLTCVVGLGLLLRLIALDQSFWLDEAAQAVISQGIFEPGRLNGDFQPPLSYFLTHVWMRFGNIWDIRSEWFLRLPAVGFGVGTVYLLFILIKDLFNRRAGLVASLMLSTAPFHIYYSQEFRMYSMLTFFAVLSWYFLWKRRWGWFALTTTIGTFTHYFALINLVSQFVYIILFDRRFVQKFFIYAALGMAPFLLWLPTFKIQLATAQNLVSAWPGWKNISNVGFLKFPGLVLAKFSVGMISPQPKWLYGAAVGAVGLGALLSSRGLLFAKDRKPVIFLLSMFAMPLVIAWFGGIFISASSPWRIQFVLPAFYALISVGTYYLARQRYARFGKFLIAYIVLQNVFFGALYLFDENNHRENWREAVMYTDNIVRDEGAIVLSEYTEPWAPMGWYSQEIEKYDGGIEGGDRVLKRSGPVILYTYLFEIFDSDKQIESQLIQNGYTLSSEKDFRGVGIIKIFSQ